jgi:hypothetical protein
LEAVPIKGEQATFRADSQEAFTILVKCENVLAGQAKPGAVEMERQAMSVCLDCADEACGRATRETCTAIPTHLLIERFMYHYYLLHPLKGKSKR